MNVKKKCLLKKEVTAICHGMSSIYKSYPINYPIDGYPIFKQWWFNKHNKTENILHTDCSKIEWNKKIAN